MADLNQILGCLSQVYPKHVSEVLARLTAQSLALIDSVVDPLASIIDKNVGGMVADITTLTTGDITSNMVDAGIGFVAEGVKKRIDDKLTATFLPSRVGTNKKTFLQEAEDRASKLYGHAMLFLSINQEAPYAIAQYLLRGVQSFVSQKTRNISCIQKNLIQLSNTVMILATNPMRSRQLVADAILVTNTEVSAAYNDVLVTRAALQGGGGFLTQRFASARTHLDNADKSLSPYNPGENIFAITEALARAALPESFSYDANRIAAASIAAALMDMVNIEFEAIRANTTVINAYLMGVTMLTANLSKVNQSSKVKEFRLRLLQQMESDLIQLISETTTPIKPFSTFEIPAL
jgi:hypothetical protein